MIENSMKKRKMSSPYGPNRLGYTRATMVLTKSCTIKKFNVNL